MSSLNNFTPERSAYLRVRATTYRDQAGFSITGNDTRGRRVSIFATTEDGAKRIKRCIQAGDHDGASAILRAGL